MHLYQTKHKMFECSHATTYNIYTLGHMQPHSTLHPCMNHLVPCADGKLSIGGRHKILCSCRIISLRGCIRGQRYFTQDGLWRIRNILLSSLHIFNKTCGHVFVSAKPNTKCLSAHMQLLMVNILWAVGGSASKRCGFAQAWCYFQAKHRCLRLWTSSRIVRNCYFSSIAKVYPWTICFLNMYKKSKKLLEVLYI